MSASNNYYKCSECGAPRLENPGPPAPARLRDMLAILFFLAVSATISIAGVWTVLSWVF
jgi:hypothetical protein